MGASLAMMILRHREIPDDRIRPLLVEVKLLAIRALRGGAVRINSSGQPARVDRRVGGFA
jgi:hypothetical protein